MKSLLPSFPYVRRQGSSLSLFTPLALLSVTVFALLLYAAVGLTDTLFLLTAMCGATLITFIAYRFPATTVFLTVALGQLIDRDMTERAWLEFPRVAGIQLRFFDPVLFGILMALVLKLLSKDRRLLKFFALFFPWTLLIVWMLGETIRGVAPYGAVSAFGEFRTYYQYLLLVPYVVAFFPTEQKQWRLFKLMMVLGLLFTVFVFLQGGLAFHFELGPRWFNASSNFALLTGIIAMYVAIRYKTIMLKTHWVVLITIIFAFITLINTHRSIWLASSVAVLLLITTGSIPLIRQIQFIVGIAAALFITSLLFSTSNRLDLGELSTETSNVTSLTEFLEVRLRGITDPQDDPTASWRSYLWQQAIAETNEQPLVGVGIGRNFQFKTKWWDVVHTSPHNYYITSSFHGGYTALVLYVFFILQVLWLLFSKLARTLSARTRTMLMTSMIVIFSAHTMFIAYHHEFFSLLYIGLSIAVIMTAKPPDPDPILPL